MSGPIEFSTAVSPSLIGGLNRNVRKFRILQYKVDQEGFFPMVLGTYGVDLTTGQPISGSGNTPNDFFSGSLNNHSTTVTPAIYDLINNVTATVAPAYIQLFMFGMNNGGAANTFNITIQNPAGVDTGLASFTLGANAAYNFDFGGLQLPPGYSVIIGDTAAGSFNLGLGWH